MPLRLGAYISGKTLGEFLEILISKAPWAEMGEGVTEFKEKFTKMGSKAS
jgi:hypothetical protein